MSSRAASDLSSLLSGRSEGELVIGTYLYPYRLLTEPRFDDLSSAIEIVAVSAAAPREILLTRNGGLFVRPPAELNDHGNPQASDRVRDFDAKVEFEENAARWFNLLICEFALLGIVSEPATPVHISRGTLFEGGIVVTGAGGGRETYLERSLGPLLELHTGLWLSHQVVPNDTVVLATAQKISLQLGGVSESLPSLVAGAYSAYSKHLLAEALVDSWIVVEQLLDWYWTKYRDSLTDGGRRKRLADSRTYSAAVRIEMMETSSILSEELCRELHDARRHRNELAHRARLTNEGADVCLRAMHHAIEFFSGKQVSPPLSSAGVGW
jgi:hypothetical protein